MTCGEEGQRPTFVCCMREYIFLLGREYNILCQRVSDQVFQTRFPSSSYEIGHLGFAQKSLVLPVVPSPVEGALPRRSVAAVAGAVAAAAAVDAALVTPGRKRQRRSRAGHSGNGV